MQFDWLVTQPYGLSIALGFAALIVADDRGRVPARRSRRSSSLTLASWVNIGVLAHARDRGGDRWIKADSADRAGRPLAAALASLAARYLASAHTITALASPPQWLDGWRQLLAGLPGVTTVPMARHRHGDRRGSRRPPGCGDTGGLPWRPVAAILAMAIGTWLVVGTSLWVGMNRYAFRYMYPTLMIVGVWRLDDLARAAAQDGQRRCRRQRVAALAVVVDGSLWLAVGRPHRTRRSTIGSAARPPPCCAAAPR